MVRMLLTLTFVLLTPLYSRIYLYDITKGETKRQVEWKIEKNAQDGVEFHSQNYMENVSHDLKLSPDLKTLSWHYLDSPDHVTYKVERFDDELVFEGTIGEKKLDKRVSIGELPWYQMHGYSLRTFLQSDEKEIEFYSIRPKDGKVVKLVATRGDVESIIVNGQRCKSIRVDVGLAGLLSYLGKVSYWFRTSDLVFVKYKGVTGFPGSTPVVYELDSIKPSDSNS